MKYCVIALLGIVGLLLAEGEEGAAPDPGRLLSDLSVANASKDTLKIASLTGPIAEAGKTSKDQASLDALAAELHTSLKLCKGNWGTLGKIVDAMGELHSKKTLSTLKRIAYKKKTKNADEENLQAKAIDAIAKLRDSRQIKPLGELTKNRTLAVAKAAYKAFRHYGTEKGRVRRNIAELLMKRIEMEYPSSGGQRSTNVSEEKQKRWGQVSPVIVASLQAICRQPTINDIDNWREWWRENKKNPRAWRDKT